MSKVPYYNQIKNKSDRNTVVNDTFMYIWTKIKDGKLSDNIDELEDYIFISCRNNSLAFRRKQMKETKRNIEYEDEKDTRGYEDKHFNSEEVDRKLDYLRNKLSMDDEKEMFRLVSKGYKYKEVANRLDLEHDRVKKTMYNIRRKLRIIINKSKEKQL